MQRMGRTYVFINLENNSMEFPRLNWKDNSKEYEIENTVLQNEAVEIFATII